MNRFISLFKRKPVPEYKILANKVLQSLEAVTYAFGLSKKDVKKIWKIFDSMDLNHTGLIDASYVGALMNASSLPYVRRMLLFYNWDHTGRMDFPEYLLMVWNFCTLDNFSMYEFIYDLLDEEKCGFIHGDQLSQFIKDVFGPDWNITPEARLLIRDIPFGNMQLKDVKAYLMSHANLTKVLFELQALMRAVVHPGGLEYWVQCRSIRNKLPQARLKNGIKFAQQQMQQLKPVFVEEIVEKVDNEIFWKKTGINASSYLLTGGYTVLSMLYTLLRPLQHIPTFKMIVYTIDIAKNPIPTHFLDVYLIGDGWSKDAFFEGQYTPKKAVGQINVFLFLERDEQAAKRASARVKAEKRKQKKRAFREWKSESLLIVRDNRQITLKYEQPVPTTAYDELAFPPEGLRSTTAIGKMRSEGYVKVYEDKPEVKKSSKSEKTPEEIEKEVAAILARARPPGAAEAEAAAAEAEKNKSVGMLARLLGSPKKSPGDTPTVPEPETAPVVTVPTTIERKLYSGKANYRKNYTNSLSPEKPGKKTKVVADDEEGYYGDD